MGRVFQISHHPFGRQSEIKGEVMGLFSYYLGYKRATKKARAARDSYEEDSEEICDNCGYAARQHSDAGECPTY
jgi:rubrerythrin